MVQAEGAPGVDDRLVDSEQTSSSQLDGPASTNTCNANNDDNANENNDATTTTVTPPPANAEQPTTAIIPPGLVPSDQGTETALSWLRRSEASLAALDQPPTDEEYLLGADFRDVCVQEFWGGGGAGTAAAALACTAGANAGDGSTLWARRHNRTTPADAALARHETMERRRRKWRTEHEDGETSVGSGRSNKRRRGGRAGSDVVDEDGRCEAVDQEAPSSIPPILASVRRGCGLSFVDLALLQPAAKTNKLAGSSSSSSNNNNSSSSCQYPVMEVRGQPGTGKTRLLLTLAANYVASTSVGCYLDVERVISDSLESNSLCCRRRQNGCDGNANGNGGHMHVNDEEEQPNAAGDDPLLPLSQDSTGIIADTNAYACNATGHGNANTSHGRDENDDAWAAYGLGVPLTVISRGGNHDNIGKSPRNKKKGTKPIHAAASPSVVILDSDLNIHPTALVAAVRAAVLRRWGETTDVRQLLEKKRMGRNTDELGSAGPTSSAHANDEEWRRIQSEICSALSRIHIVKTNSGEGLFADAIPVLESLRHSLDLAAEQCDLVSGGTASGAVGGNRPTSAAPPTLLMIDSLTSSERRSQRLEALGSGLSGQNDFYRQLNRLRAAHPVAVVGTSTGAAASIVAGGGNAGGTGGRDSNLWSKMVTTRAGLDRKDVTAENASSGSSSSSSGAGGYDYQALVPCTTTTSGGGGTGGSLVATVPFKIDSSGIWD